MYQNDNSGWNKKMTENVNIVKRIKGNQETKEEKKKIPCRDSRKTDAT